jgi:hypothetical protein
MAYYNLYKAIKDIHCTLTQKDETYWHHTIKAIEEMQSNSLPHNSFMMAVIIRDYAKTIDSEVSKKKLDVITWTLRKVLRRHYDGIIEL